MNYFGFSVYTILSVPIKGLCSPGLKSIGTRVMSAFIEHSLRVWDLKSK